MKTILLGATLGALATAFPMPLQKLQTNSGHAISRWHYQLQGYETFVAKHSSDESTLFVLDYSKDGTERAAFTKLEIAKLKNGGKNIVLAYLSIGEAEEVRWYYPQLPKDLMKRANPTFPDNYPVKFWDARWQKRIALDEDSSLSRIAAAGFDGIYLDRVDVYAEFLKERPSAEADMIAWVVSISKRARSLSPGSLVFVQNASCLPTRPSPDYWAAIDGIGLESTFFLGSRWEDNSYHAQREVLQCLHEFRKRNKIMLGVEYVKNPAKTTRALKEMSRHGIMGLVTDRLLKGRRLVYPLEVQRK